MQSVLEDYALGESLFVEGESLQWVVVVVVKGAFTYTVSQKGTSILLPITLADVDGFSKFFHC